MAVYEGNENYIFISYAHKDSTFVLPIIEALQRDGFRVWYDGGIEAGTEWPEYIADHLSRCAVAILFISENALASKNCIREINFAIGEGREMLAVYLSDVKLTPGMKMQLGTIQAMFRNRFIDDASFTAALLDAKILSGCKEGAYIDSRYAENANEEDDLSAFFGEKKGAGGHTRNTLGFADSIPIKIYKGAVSDALQENITQNASIINRTFGELSITALVTSVDIGPIVTTYRVHVNGTMRVNAINRAVEDLKFALGVSQLRLLPPTNKDLTISIELLNEQQDIVLLEEILKEARLRESMGFETRDDTSVCLGRTANGDPLFNEITRFPHLLVSGATQTGKTTLLHSIIVSMITRVPKERLGLILVDLKGVEFDIYNDEPHMQLPVIHDSKRAASILTELCEEMERRFKIFMENGVRSLDQYNESASDEKKLPRIIFVVDDYTDLILNYRKEIENAVMRLSQKSRAAGIHLILSSQRADASTITGVLKANIPTRLAFRMLSPIESRDIIGTTEATELGTLGDALFSLVSQPSPSRINPPYIPIEKIISIVKYLIKTQGKAKYNKRIASGASAYNVPDIKPKTVKYDNYVVPPLSILNPTVTLDPKAIEEEIEETKATILSTLASLFKLTAEIKGVLRGPRITRYEMLPSRVMGAARIRELADMLLFNLGGRSAFAELGMNKSVFIFVQNKHAVPVHIRELLESEEFKESKSKTTVCIGKGLEGDSVIDDVASFPHALVGGATGMGKSVFIHSIIASILYKARPDEVKLLLIDPKTVEFTAYEGLAHLLTPVITDVNQAVGTLFWVIEEMERRYEMFSKQDIQSVDEYNERADLAAGVAEKMPKIVIIIDEIADLMMQKKAQLEELLLKIVQKGRAAGVHLILGTQRPTTNVIAGTLKANLPTRICFKVSSHNDSSTVLGKPGAEKLLPSGDMLMVSPKSIFTRRVQGVFISDSESRAIVNHVINETTDKKRLQHDPLLIEAVDVAMANGGITTAFLQRRFSIGYSRAARLIDDMEELGIIGGFNGSKPREVLLSREAWQNLKGIIENE